MVSSPVVVCLQPSSSYRSFERILRAAGAPAKDILTFHSVETLKRCAIEGVGMTILPKIAVEKELAAGDLTCLDWEDAFEVAVLMIWYKERRRSPALEAFMQIARTILRANYG
jgi:DNA-binding transcriptional LysR family regulator